LPWVLSRKAARFIKRLIKRYGYFHPFNADNIRKDLFSGKNRPSEMDLFLLMDELESCHLVMYQPEWKPTIKNNKHNENPLPQYQ